MATITSEALFGLAAVQANPEANAVRDANKERPVIFSTCPLHDGDTLTISNKADDLVGSYRNRPSDPWREGLRVSVNGKDEVITPTLLTKLRSALEGGIAQAKGDLNDAFNSLKGLNREDFNAALAKNFSGDYLVTESVIMTVRMRYQDGIRYTSAEHFYSVNKK